MSFLSFLNPFNLMGQVASDLSSAEMADASLEAVAQSLTDISVGTAPTAVVASTFTTGTANSHKTVDTSIHQEKVVLNEIVYLVVTTTTSNSTVVRKSDVIITNETVISSHWMRACKIDAALLAEWNKKKQEAEGVALYAKNAQKDGAVVLKGNDGKLVILHPATGDQR